MVVSAVDLLSLQCLVQTLLERVSQLSCSATSQPSQFPPSRSARRWSRRQATLRKLYSASVVDVCSQVNGDCSAPASSALRSPAHIPTVSPLHASPVEALSDDDVATIICDIPNVQLNTYDCSKSALCYRSKTRLEADFQLLQVRGRHLREAGYSINMVFAGMDSSHPTPALELADNSTFKPEISSASDVVDAFRSSRPIASSVSQPAARSGPLFKDDVPQSRGQECKQQ